MVSWLSPDSLGECRRKNWRKRNNLIASGEIGYFSVDPIHQSLSSGFLFISVSFHCGESWPAHAEQYLGKYDEVPWHQARCLHLLVFPWLFFPCPCHKLLQ